MKKLTSILFTIAMCLCLAFAVSACGPTEEPPAVTVTLSKTTIAMDVYDKATLTATVENSENSVTWSSSNTAVATVEDGLVKALSVGEAVITASVSDSAKATCVVTVTNSGTVPVLQINGQSTGEVSISIDAEEEFVLPVQTLWKGLPIDETVQYAWTLSENATDGIATVETVSTGAKFKGVEYGKTQFTVSATVRGTLLVRTVDVTVVDSDVTFEIDNFEPVEGGYKAKVALISDGTEHFTSVIPALVVNDDGVEQTVDLTFVVDDESIATVDATTGEITAVSEGTTFVTTEYQGNSVKIFVEVYRPTIQKTDVYTVETASSTVTFAVDGAITDAITDVTLDGVSVFDSFDGGIVTLNKSALPITADKMGQGRVLVLETEKASYEYSANIYTMIINTADELKAFDNTADLVDGADDANGNGYFVLGNDIMNAGEVNLTNGGDYRFQGVFDGQGYRIDGMQVTTQSFLRGMNGDGTIKNVAFTNAVHTGTRGFLLTTGNGTLENIYISLAVTKNGGTSGGTATSVLISSSGNDFTVRKVFIEYTSLKDGNSTYGGYIVGERDREKGVYEGLYAVGVDKLFEGDEGQTASSTYIAGLYETYDALTDASVDFTSWANGFWEIKNGLPRPKKLTSFALELPATASAGESVTVPSGYGVLYSIDSASVGAGVTLADNKINIPANFKGAITFTATSVYGEEPIVKQILVTATKTLATTTDIDMYTVSGGAVALNGNTATVDLSSLATDIGTNEFDSATMDGVAIEVAVEGTTLTFNKSQLGYKFGNKNIVLKYVDGNDNHILSISVPVRIISMIINDEIELAQFNNLASSYGNGTANRLDGLFLLGGNITWSGTATYSYKTSSNRFYGTFDGQGYAIDGFSIGGTNSFVRGLMDNGIIKNVSFTNVTSTTGRGFLFTEGHGTIENVYIEVNSITNNGQGSSNPGASTALIGSGPLANFKINNVLVEYTKGAIKTGSNTYGGYLFGNNQYFESAINGVYAVGVTQLDNNGEYTTGEGYGAYTDYASLKSAVTFTSWANDFWEIKNGLPVPKKLKEVTITAPQSAVAGESFVLSGGYGVEYSLDATSVSGGVTIDGNTVSVPSTFSGTIKVTATSVFDSAKTSTTSTVITLALSLSKTNDVDMYTVSENALTLNGATAPIDLSEIATTLNGLTLNSASIGDTTVGATMSGTTVSIDKEDLGLMFGNKTLALTFKDGSDNLVLTVTAPIRIASMIITSAEELGQFNNLALTYANGTANRLDGLFLLGSNITWTSANTYSYKGADYRFQGTFDGQGYTIDGFIIGGTNSFLRGMAKDSGASVKNVSFTNVTNTSGRGMLLTCGYGEVENVYVEFSSITTNGGTGTTNSTAGLVTQDQGVIFNKVYLVYKNGITNGSATYGGYPFGEIKSVDNLNGVYAVGVSHLNNAKTTTTGEGYGAYADTTTLKSAVTFTSWDNDFWDVVDGLPVPTRIATANN